MGIAASIGSALSIWSALRWSPVRFDSLTIPAIFNPTVFSPSVFHTSLNLSWIAAALFAIPAAVLLLLAFRPAIEIHDSHLNTGSLQIPWNRVRKVDQTGWNVPLLVYLTLDDDSRVALLHPGNVDSSASLLRHLRRSAREALLDGVPHKLFWGEPPASGAPARIAPLRYPLLRPEDEQEVERLFQRLKSVGHLEQQHRDADQE